MKGERPTKIKTILFAQTQQRPPEVKTAEQEPVKSLKPMKTIKIARRVDYLGTNSLEQDFSLENTANYKEFFSVPQRCNDFSLDLRYAPVIARNEPVKRTSVVGSINKGGAHPTLPPQPKQNSYSLNNKSLKPPLPVQAPTRRQFRKLSDQLASTLKRDPSSLLLNSGPEWLRKKEAINYMDSLTPLHSKTGNNYWYASLRLEGPNELGELYVPVGNALCGLYTRVKSRSSLTRGSLASSANSNSLLNSAYFKKRVRELSH